MKKYEGKVIMFKESGFGFLYCDELRRRVFFHIKHLHGPEPLVGEILEFSLGPSPFPGKQDEAVEITRKGLEAVSEVA
jgi:cold shock CspA family protein